MKNILLLAGKDFNRKWKNPVVILGFLLIPIIFTFILGLIFGSSEEDILPTVSLLVSDNDQSLISQFFLTALTQGELKDILNVEKVDEGKGRDLLNGGKASAHLIIPENFGSHVWEGRPVELLLLKNPSEQFLPQIAAEICDITTLLFSSLFTVFGDEINSMKAMVDKGELLDSDISSVSIRVKNRVDGIAKYIFPPVIGLKRTTATVGEEEDTGDSLTPYSYIFPAMAIMFLLFICNVVFEDLLREKESGTLLRLTVSPMTLTEFIWSKVLTSALIGMLCTSVLILIGHFVFSIRWGNPLLLPIIIASLNILLAGFIAFLYSFVHTERQAGAVLSSVIIVMSLLGGSMMPVQNFPDFIKPISRLTVNYWGLEAFRMSIMREPVMKILILLAGMVLCGILFSLISSHFLHKNLRKGLIN